MAKFSFKDTIGYKYHSEMLGDYVIIKQINQQELKAKLPDHPTCISTAHPEWGIGYITIIIETHCRRLKTKTPYVDESLDIIDVVKAWLTLK